MFKKKCRSHNTGVTAIAAGAVAVVGLAFSAPLRADVSAGVVAYERGDYDKAVEEWRVDAATGDVNALFNLGQAYRLGRGVETDLAMAEQYYTRAAQGGHPAAMGNLGTLYYFSKTPPETVKAIDWWRQGAVAGDARSQYMLGVVTFNGQHVKRDLVTAYAWSRLAAKAGMEEAKVSAATMTQYLTAEQIAAAEKRAPTLMSSEGRRYWKGFLPEEEPEVTVTDLEAPPSSPSAENPSPPADDAAAAQETVEQAALKTADNVSLPPRDEAPAQAQSSPPEDASQAPATRASVFRLNLAAMSERERAERLWQDYRKDHEALLDAMPHRIVPLSRQGQTLYRLQAGHYSDRGEAAKKCGALQAAGIDCFVVRTAE